MSGYIGPSPVPQATQTRETFTATASQTSFATAGYTVGYLDVFLNGVKLVSGDDYMATNGSDVVLTTGAAANDVLEVVAYRPFEVVNQSFTGDFSVDSPTFVVDSANNRVGIGTTSPSQALHLSGGNIMRLDNGAGAFWDVAGGGSFTLEDNGTERLRIDSSGNVGIGTSSPQDNLHVAGDSGSLSLERTGSSFDGTFRLVAGGTTGGGFRIFDDTLGTSLERMRISAGGSLFVGTTSMTIGSSSNTSEGFGFSSDNVLQIARDAIGGKIVVQTLGQTAASTQIAFLYGSSNVGGIISTSSSTSYNTSSDERLKENIADAQPASDLIDGIQVREFDWKVDGEHQRYGMIAQELEAVAPEAVTKGETEDDMWSVDYSKLVPMLTAALQESMAKIQALEARVTELETN